MNVTLNGTSITFKQGVIINECLSEKLDTGLLLATHAVLSIEPLDQIVITSGTYSKNMMVANYKRTTSSFTTPSYNYTIGLTSPTIQLQRIVLPNRSVTQPVTGTKTDIYTVLSQYVSMYSNFTISTALETLTTDVDCPEFQWNRPTLFEVLNDLLSEVDAVVSMSSFTEISYLDLNVDGGEITITDFTELEESQDVTDYCNKIECEVSNAIVGKRNTRCVQWVTLKTDEDAVVTSDNFKLILEKNIYKINSIEQRYYDGSTSTLYSEDVTDHVVEKTAYDLLYPSISSSIVSGDYKRDHYYYKEGSNTIEGLNYHEDKWTTLTSERAINNVFSNATGGFTTTNLLEYVFKVDYIAQETVKFVSNKETSNSNNSTLTNNQEVSYVDFNAFSNKQYNTVNRIGNKLLTITDKLTDTTIPSLGAYYGDYKISERTLAIYEDIINFKGTASLNYVMEDIYAGLKQERRFTKIADTSDALECNHIQEINLNLSNTDATSSVDLEEYIMNYGQADSGIEVVWFTTDVSTDDFVIAPSSYYTPNSLILSWKMYDNFNVGIASDTSVEFVAGTTVGVFNTPYVDDDGKFTTFDYKLYKSMDNDYLDTPTTSFWNTGVIRARNYPVYPVLNTLNDLVYSDSTIYRYKDNREITVETLQFNITSDSNIIYSLLFLKNSALIYTDSTSVTSATRYVAYSETETYKKGDTEIKGTIADIADLRTSRADNYYRVYSPSGNLDVTDFASWAICDADGNIYLANNGNDDYIYLNKE